MIFPTWKSPASLGAWCCGVCPFRGWALFDSQPPSPFTSCIEWVAPNLWVFFHTQPPFSLPLSHPLCPHTHQPGRHLHYLLVGKSRLHEGIYQFRSFKSSEPKPCRQVDKWINNAGVWLGTQLTLLGTEFKFHWKWSE